MTQQTVTKKSPSALKRMNVRKLAKHLDKYARQANLQSHVRASKTYVFCNHTEVKHCQAIRVSKDNKPQILDLIAEVYATG